MKTIVRILTTAAAVMMLANFANAQPQEICQGTGTTWYRAINASPDAGATWAWAVDGTPLAATTQEISIDWSAYAAGDYTITVQEMISGCPGTEYSLVVSINALPTVTFADASITVCAGDAPASFDLTLDGPLAGTWDPWTVTWNIDGVAQETFDNIVGASYTITPTDAMAASGSITVTVYDGQCSNTGTNVITATVPDGFNTTGIETFIP